MGEPLHLKALWLRDYDLVNMKEKIKLALMENLEPKDHMFHAEDIKSAVEWLKEELKGRSKEQWDYYEEYDERQSQGKAQGLDEAIQQIEKAFPDIKEEERLSN